jgi:L-rhamnose-H+ transport protein
MSINYNIIPIILAGIMNGSFVVPTRYTKGLTQAKTWCLHSIIGMLIIPWGILFCFSPESFANYKLLPFNDLCLIIVSGLIFGIGQIGFAKSIEKLGIALSFTINISLGVIIGSLYVVFYKHAFFTLKGALVVVSVLLIVFGLIIKYFSTSTSQASGYKSNYFIIGWLLALFTGITSGLQNITFVTIAFSHNIHIQAQSSFWVWPLFLTIGALPMFIGFLYLSSKEKSADKRNMVSTKAINLCFIIVMGIFFAGSLYMYSYGMDHLHGKLQIVGWPTFMVGIILTTQIWGYIYREHHISKQQLVYQATSIVLLLTAIIILSLVN